jgi:membrane associated rhomboid family serine protease
VPDEAEGSHLPGVGARLRGPGAGRVARYHPQPMAGTRETRAPEALHCYRHPDRETLVACSSCDRPICTSCMTQAAVGVRCPECAGRSRSGRGGRVRGVRAPSGAVLATGTLIVVNLLIYAAEMAQGVGLRGVAGSQLVRDGAVFGPGVADGEWWRLVTGGFLHASLIHVGFNMYLLWILGGALERYAGTARLLAVYFSGLLWGSAGALLLSPNSLTVGASGAVFGLMAALYLLERQRGIALLGSTVGMLLVLNLVITFVLPGISVGGHLGGIVGGAAAGFVLSGYGRGHMAYGRLGAPGWLAIAAVMAGAVILSLAIV